jgi:hypothetical protein
MIVKRSVLVAMHQVVKDDSEPGRAQEEVAAQQIPARRLAAGDDAPAWPSKEGAGFLRMF